MSHSANSDSTDDRTEAAIADFLRRIDLGEDVGRGQFLARYPDIADRLREYFADYDSISRLANSCPSLAQSVDGNNSPSTGRPTISTDSSLQEKRNHYDSINLPRRFGDYELLQEIAHGGMGVVYKARQISLRRYVALKTIRQQHLATRSDILRFRREAAAAASLQHPNIVAVHEVGECADQLYFTMDYVSGPSLADALRNGPLPIRVAAEHLHIISAAVDYAHSLGILHRDLKPANILLDEHDRPRITDFGIAARIEAGSTLTATGQIIGTPSYMSPEQSSAENGSVGLQSDIYSLGAVLYELLTGHPPFRGESTLDIFVQIRDCEPIAPRLLNTRIPADLETICLKCLQKNPALRYDSAQELADDIGRFLEEKPIRARPIGNCEKMWRWCRRNSVVASLAAIATLLVCITISVTSFAYFRESKLHSDVQLALERESATHQEVQQHRLAALQAQKTAERELVETQIASARSLGERGEIARGLAWLAHSMDHITPATTHLKPCLQRNISSFRANLHELLRAMDCDHEVYALACSPDGTTILTGGPDGFARLWNIQTAKPLGYPMPHNDAVAAVAFSPDGTTILTGTTGRIAQLWSTETGEPIGQPIEHRDTIECTAYSPDGRLLLTGSVDHTARIWDASTTQPVGQPLLHEHIVWDAIFSPDGKSIITACEDGGVRFWDTDTQQLIGVPMMHPDGVSAVAVSPQGNMILTGCRDGFARLWNTETGLTFGQPMKHEATVSSVAFSPDGRTVLTGGYDKIARLWDATTGEPVSHPLEHEYWIGTVSFSPDGERLITGSRNGIVRVWNARKQQHIRYRLQHSTFVSSVAFSPDGQTVLTGSSDKTAQLWSAATREPIGQPLRHEEGVTCVAFSRDGQQLVTGSFDETARVWNATSGEPIGEPLHHSGKVHGAAFGPENRFLYTACEEKNIRKWDLATAECVGSILNHPSRVFGIALSPDGERAVTRGDDNCARLWNLKTETPIGRPLQHEGWVTSIAFSPNGETIVTGSYDKTARLWNAHTGAPLGRLMFHDNEVWAVAFSPDGTMVATACYDRTARLWDAESGLSNALPFHHKRIVGAIAFSPNGRDILTGSGSEAILIPSAVPVCSTENLRQIALQNQVSTGMELTEDERFRVLDTQTWNERRNRLEGDY